MGVKQHLRSTLWVLALMLATPLNHTRPTTSVQLVQGAKMFPHHQQRGRLLLLRHLQRLMVAQRLAFHTSLGSGKAAMPSISLKNVLDDGPTYGTRVQSGVPMNSFGAWSLTYSPHLPNDLYVPDYIQRAKNSYTKSP
jgi:hypothetical protein